MFGCFAAKATSPKRRPSLICLSLSYNFKNINIVVFTINNVNSGRNSCYLAAKATSPKRRPTALLSVSVGKKNLKSKTNRKLLKSKTNRKS